VAGSPTQFALPVTIVVRFPSLPRKVTASPPTYGSLRWHGKPVSLTNVPRRTIVFGASVGVPLAVGRIIGSIPATGA
jgi:hypothetical protein